MNRASRAEQHQALVRRAPEVVVEQRGTPVPGAGEVLIAPTIAGLCGTDIQMLRGLRSDPAPVIGHEGVGHIVALGAGASDRFTVGDLVVVNPTHPTDDAFLLGHNIDGMLQERVLIPASAVEGGLVLSVPELPTPELFALLEPLAAVRYSMSLLEPEHPEVLVVYGDGVVGHLAVRAAARWLDSVKETVLVHHTEHGLKWTSSAGTGPDISSRLDHVEEVRAAVAGRASAALVATPRNATVACLESALRALPEPTTIDLVGGLAADARTPLLPGVDPGAVRRANRAGFPQPGRIDRVRTASGKWVGLTGHRGVSNSHLLDAAAELARVPGRYRDLVTHVTDLDGAAQIMQQLSHRTDRTVDGSRLIKLAVRINGRQLLEER